MTRPKLTKLRRVSDEDGERWLCNHCPAICRTIEGARQHQKQRCDTNGDRNRSLA